MPTDETYVGARLQVSGGEETMYGQTAPNTQNYLGDVESNVPTDNLPSLDIYAADGSDSLNLTKRVKLIPKYGGTLTTKVTNAYLLKYVFGNYQSMGGGGPYWHSFYEDNLLPSMSLVDVKYGQMDLTKLYKGVVFSDADFQWSSGNPLKIIATWVAQDLDLNYFVPPVFADQEDPYMFYELTLNFDGQNISRINSGNLKCVYTLIVPEYCDTNGFIGQPIVAKRKWELNFEVNMNDRNFLDKLKNANEVWGQVRFFRQQDGTYIEFNLEGIFIESAIDPSDTNADVVKQTIKCKVSRVNANASDFKPNYYG